MKEFAWTLTKGLLPYCIILFAFAVLMAILAKLKNNAVIKINQKIAEKKTGDGICPRCGGKLIVRNGKYGNFIGCSNFPACRYTTK